MYDRIRFVEIAFRFRSISTSLWFNLSQILSGIKCLVFREASEFPVGNLNIFFDM